MNKWKWSEIVKFYDVEVRNNTTIMCNADSMSVRTERITSTHRNETKQKL